MRPLLPPTLSLLVLACGTQWRVEDQDGDGLTVIEGDCWDAPAGPEGSGLSGAEIFPGASERWYDGIDQDCAGDDDFDADGDGWTVDEDCDDLDASINLGAIETWYDGIDQDCAEDDDFDQDGDGWTVNEDCDDLDARINPAAAETWYDGTDQDCAGDDDFDQDGDGFVSGEHGGSDCDDLDPARRPDGSQELYYDGIDNNCDTRDGDGDADEDGWWAIDYADRVEASGGVPLPVPEGAEGDCWDDPDHRPAEFVAVNLPPLQADEVSPGAVERYYDAVDQDCDGDLERDFDQDADGHPTDQYRDRSGSLGGDCDDLDAAIRPEAVETWYDGIDQDCSGDNDFDQDGDSHEAAGTGIGSNDDCDDEDAGINPSRLEDCATLADDDCSGSTNDAGALDCTVFYQDADHDGYGRSDLSRCTCIASGSYTATSGGDCLDTGSRGGVPASSIHPDATEVCNEIDDDCDDAIDDADGSLDGSTADRWYADGDGDGHGDASSSLLRCQQPTGHVADDTDCDDADPGVHPGATEICDEAGADEDCNGLADDDDAGASGKTTWYADADTDGFGDPASTLAACEMPSGYVDDDTDCDDSRAAVNPEAQERCSTLLIDDDCDGSAEEPDAADTTTFYADADLDGYGDAGATTEACSAPSGHVSDDTDCNDTDGDVNPGALDDADDVDSDCDGWIDEASVQPGDVVLTEILAGPAGSEPQWFEIYNASSLTLHLDGWQLLVDGAGLDFCLSADAALSLAPGERLVLCAAEGAAGCDYTWQANSLTDFSSCSAAEPDFVIDLSGDGLSIILEATTIDAVDWSGGGWPAVVGASMELGESGLDATTNDSATSWCEATTAYDTGNAGTPGGPASCTP